MQIIKKILVFLLIILGSQGSSLATHLMGGSLVYEYLGLNTGTGLYQYQVTVTIYRYCSGNPTPAQLPNIINLGVYRDDLNNLPGNKLLVLSTTLPLISQQPIVPANPNDSCNFNPNVCVEEGIYQGIVSLTPNSTGYYFASDRCCRNGNIINLDNPGAAGQVYYAYAPEPTTVNSSPTFALAPVPFICANDTSTILNSAFDIDGDSLVYSFAIPYDGISSSGQPNPNPPNIYQWPIQNINYTPGFSVTNPFGTGGFAGIDSSTGLTTYFASSQGFYVLAVEIKEYRNGVLIGVTRRDLQIIVIACPVNPAPTLSSTTTQTTYTMQEGQSLCFSSVFNDANGDSIYITHTGDIFKTTITNPAATFVDGSGLGTATGQFCWSTSCSQGRTNPYQFSIVATDNGCPAKTINLVYTINVVNTPKPATMAGVDTLCFETINSSTYNVPAVAGYTNNWFVTNGTIVGSSTGNSVNVSFAASGNAFIKVVAVNAYGCVSDTLIKQVFIKPKPSALAGNDVAICSGNSVAIGSANTVGYGYSWSPATGLSSSTVSNPLVTLSNGTASPQNTSYILTTTLSGCTNKDTVVVTTNPRPISNAGVDASICSGASVNIGTTTTAGYTYAWTPSSGLSNAAISNPSLILTNTNNIPDTLSYVVLTTNTFGCTSTDTMKIVVRPVPNALAGTDITFCSGANGTIGAAAVAGYTYSWTPSTGLTSTTTSTTGVTLTNSNTVNDTLSYILTATWFGCTDKDTVKVVVRNNPISNAGANQYLCSGSTVNIGTSNTAGYTYSWSPTTGLSSTSISNPTVTIANTNPTPDTLNFIVTTTLNGCVTRDTVQVISSPAPNANAGTDITFCSGGNGTLGSANTSGYAYSWSPATGLSSSTVSNPAITRTTSLTVNDTVSYILTTTLFGCIDKDTVKVIVRPNPVSNAGLNQLLCSGSTITLGNASTAGYTYSWSPSTGLSSTTISNPTATIINTNATPDTLTYVVTTSLNGCVTRDTAIIVSSPAPNAIAGTDITFCSGGTGVIGAAPVANYVYAWSPTIGLTSSTSSLTNITRTTSLLVNDTVNYIVTTNLFGCIDKDTVKVIVRPNPVSTAGANQNLCSGSTIQLGGATTSGYNYSWSPTSGLSSATSANPTLTLTNNTSTQNTLLYVVTTTLNGCATTDTVQITSSPVPTAQAGTDVTFCSGQSVSIGSPSVSGYSYSWSPSSGLSSSTTSTPGLILTNPTQLVDTVSYIVTVNWFGCIDKDTVVAFVKPLPISEAGLNTTLCSQDTLRIGTLSTAGYVYSWTPATGLSSTTSSNPLATLNNAGSTATSITYLVTTTWNGCSTNDSILINVNPLPAVQASSLNASICLGANTVLNAAGASTYSWALLSAPTVSIGNGNSISVSPTVSTSYILTGTSSVNCVNSDTILITVNPLPNVQLTSLSDSICSGDTISLNASGANSYSWSISGGGGSIGSGSPLQVFPTTNTTYVLTGIDGNQCVNRDTVTIRVNPAPTASAIIGTLSVCPGVDSVQYWIANPNPTSSYSWTITNGTIASGQGTDTIFIDWSDVSGNGLVSVEEITDRGCVSRVPVELPVVINVILTPVAPTGISTICANSASGLTYTTVNTPSSTYNWFIQGGNIISGNGTSSVVVDWTVLGPQTVALWYEETSVTNITTCFGVSDTIFVTINPNPITSSISGTNAICVNDTSSFAVNNTVNSTYNWTLQSGNIISGNGSNSISANWTLSGNDTIAIIETNSYGCVGNEVDFPIVINALPNADAGVSTSICINKDVQLNATGGQTYQWTPSLGLDNPAISNPIANPSNTTTYFVLVTDINGCKQSDSVVVTVNPLPVVTTSGNTAICIGSSTTISANGGISYLWTPNDALSSNTAQNPTANPQGTTTYSVNVTDANGCTNDANLTVTVNPLPTAVATPNTTICAGSSLALFAEGGDIYSWSPATALNSTSIPNPISTPTSTITYVVTVTDLNGCQDDTSVVIEVNEQPKAEFFADSNSTVISCNGVSVNLINQSTDALNYLWNFGDGASSTEENPSHLYSFGDPKLITLIAINNICSDTVELDFAPQTISSLLANVPNVFSPNNDGVNDCYDLGDKIDFRDCSDWSVFNRWGQKVFQSSSSQNCWNGKQNSSGDDLPTGAYFYILNVNGGQYKGTISLFR